VSEKSPAGTVSSPGTASESGAERAGRILAIAREVLSEPGITADDELTDHGGTSLSIVRIIAVASRTLGLDINPRDLEGTVTVRNLARVARRSPHPEAGP
jgi:acyl carrier protein